MVNAGCASGTYWNTRSAADGYVPGACAASGCTGRWVSSPHPAPTPCSRPPGQPASRERSHRLDRVTRGLSKQTGQPCPAQPVDHLAGNFPGFALDARNQLPPDKVERIHGSVIIESDPRGQQR